MEADYQLQVEDAILFSEHEACVIVDALKTGKEPFTFKKIRPVKNFSFTTHAVSPNAVGYLCRTLYRKSPEIYILGIRGYDFEVGEDLSSKARQNLKEALSFFVTILKNVTPDRKISAIIKILIEKNLKKRKERKSHGKKQKRSSGA
jgi:hydrogenase maturation protease